MKYLMLVCLDPTLDRATVTDSDDVEPWVEQMDAQGIRLVGNVLEPETQARTVRRRRGELVVTDGPFLETKEVLAGFDVLECDSLEHAIEVAAAHPMSAYGAIDLRPMLPD